MSSPPSSPKSSPDGRFAISRELAAALADADAADLEALVGLVVSAIASVELEIATLTDRIADLDAEVAILSTT